MVWACDQLKKINGQRITLKTRHLNEFPQYSQVTLVSGYPFWQLSFDHNMDVHKDVHFQLRHRLYMLWTQGL